MHSAIVLLFAQLLGPGITPLHYTGRFTIPRWPHPNTFTIIYDDLYPGKRSERGGCYFMDNTNPKSYMPIIEDKPDHVTIRAPRGHVIEWHCNWNVSK